ncbi:TRAP transporter substrate-binding protein DctP [Agrobacterium sp. a22-2]|uniref:TRAP transporter substrate-binding protein DctP n=1 Tax=Agrobacterium sp. a22-2 TaxID=2283840 RepID=UPI00144796BA|nr:TRAP transporter substrate-binding protein DctP [Agrobacterium sp. a22-2]NKN39282.1 TRAP transporter substrate-binding protein DctP [Agrobacterium sp. a22-2]
MRYLKALAFAALLGGFATAVHAEEVVLNAVHFTPAQNGFAQSFLKFVAKVNEAGKGVVQINVRGGPEVIPNPQLGTAQKSGLVDLVNAPAGLYLEMVPEGEVFSASTAKPWDVRANGGWDLINSIYEKKGNAHLLAHIDAGTGFHIFTVNEPEMTPDGSIDFSKLTLRSSPLYRQFFEALGTTVIVQNAGDVYTSLERGVINGNAYPIMGYASFGWDKFTKYRVDPSFFQVDVLVSMNKAKWDSLSPEAQKILNDAAIAYERESYDAMVAETDRLAKVMIDGGQKVVEMTGAGREKFLATAAKASWDRMAERDPTNVEALRKLFP